MSIAVLPFRTIALALALAAAPMTASAADPTLSIEARLYGAKTGKLSDDVLADPGRLLGNVIIGDDPSSSTLVTVKVASDKPLPQGARVRVVATELTSKSGRGAPGKPVRRILDLSSRVPYHGEAGDPAYVAFWLPETGCAPIALTAELLAPPARKVATEAKLDFACYE